MNQLSFPLEPLGRLFDSEIRCPRLWIQLRFESQWSETIKAYVDTGSPVSLVERSLVESLGVDLATAGMRDTVRWGASKHEILRVELDLALKREPFDDPDRDALILPACVFGVWTETGVDPVLLGQHGALERLSFQQRNFSPYDDGFLRRP